jgi:hypothetical protein
LLLTLVASSALAHPSTGARDAASEAEGQGTATSSITGVVVDTDGGFVPGATIVAKSDSTSAESRAVSAANGSFTIPALNVGSYTVTVSLQGFKTAVLKDVLVSAGAPGTVRAVLEIGGLQETVVVEGATEVIQTQSAAASTTINTKSITSLPVSSRSSLDFVAFLPGVQTAGGTRDSIVNGLPQSSISMTLDGVNIQDNTLKTSDGFFAMVSPRLDAIEEVTLTTAGQGAESTGTGATQIRFTTRSGCNRYIGSFYHFYQDEKLDSNSYSNRVRGLAKGPRTLNQPGFRQGGPVVIPGLYDGRGKMFFFVNYEQPMSPGTTTSNSTLLLAHAQNGIFKYPNGPAGGINLYALAAANGQVSTPDPIIGKLLQDIRNSTAATGVLSEITGNLNAERLTWQQATGGDTYYPTLRGDYNLSDKHRLSVTWYRQVFPQTVDTTNTRQRTWPNFPMFGNQSSRRKAYTGTVRSNLGANLVNEARLGYSAGPVEFSPNVNLGMWTSPLAFQNGFQLGISAAGITNAGNGSTNTSARDASVINFADTVNWLKGSHSISLGGEFGRFDIWNGTYNSNVAPSISFGVQTGDPALAMFTSANFPGSSNTDRTAAQNLYAVLVGRITAIGATARLNPATGKYVYQGDQKAEGRMQQGDFFVQDSWKFRPNLSLNLGLRYSVQFPFAALNSSYSTATLDDVWGITGYKPGCDLSAPTKNDCYIFQPGVLNGQKPSYQNLGKGVKAYKTDWGNLAPSVGVNWTPNVESGFLRKLLGGAGDTSFSGGYSRAYDRRGMGDFTGVFGNNPGLNVTATRSTGNSNLTLPLLFRDGYLGAPPTCPPLPAAKPAGCVLGAPEYPLFNQNANSSINVFNPDLQVPYSDTWTAGIQRALGTKSAIEVRYIGTRSREQWFTADFNEANIIENGFLDEFKLAQQNLIANIAAGGSRAGSFAYFGPGTGTSPLPIYLAYFSAVPRALSGDVSRYTSSNFTNSNFVNPLTRYGGNPFTPAGTNSNTSLSGDPTRQANAIAAGLPPNFFRVNPDMLGGARATGNGGYTKYNGMQVQYRRRLSGGLQFDANYTFGKALESTRYSFRVPRILTRNTGNEGDVTHALKATFVYETPFGRGRRFGANVHPVVDYVIGGWQLSGTARIQSGQLFDLGNVRLNGMTVKDVEKMFKLRIDSTGTLIYAWPEDVIAETIKAYSTSATSLTGYGSLGPPSGRYFSPANGLDCIESIAGDYGECGMRTLVVTGPTLKNFDLSLRKIVKLHGRLSYELSMDVFNVFNVVSFTPTLGIGGTQLSSYQASLPGSLRRIQIGTRFSW